MNIADSDLKGNYGGFPGARDDAPGPTLPQNEGNVHSFGQGAQGKDPGDGARRARRLEATLEGGIVEVRDLGVDALRAPRPDQRLAARLEDPDTMRQVVSGVQGKVWTLEIQVESLGDAVLQLLEMVSKLQARMPEGEANSSAPLKRSMNQADAELCIRDLRPHEAVANELGLTYAQVYSCRLEYTFKKVHAKLRREGFVSTWTKPPPRRI